MGRLGLVVATLMILAGGFSMGTVYGFREAVRRDYQHCAESMWDRLVANHDAVGPMPNNFLDVGCVDHADSVWGGSGWRSW